MLRSRRKSVKMRGGIASEVWHACRLVALWLGRCVRLTLLGPKGCLIAGTWFRVFDAK